MPFNQQEKLTPKIAPCAFLFLWLACSFVVLQAQTYTSGSTGALGAFAPTKDIEVQLPDNGELHYTTINIPAGVTVTFKRNAKNTPVFMLAKDDVTIAGAINISGKNGNFNNSGTIKTTGGAGGPGGFNGGSGGFLFDPYFNGNTGDGPGGGGGGLGSFDGSVYGDGGGGGYVLAGQAGIPRSNVNSFGIGGSSYGSRLLLPLIGGSGGGGGSSFKEQRGDSGGGGGGAILLASSGTITFTGSVASIFADGGNGHNGDGVASYGGGGAGGAIRLVATNITGLVNLYVRGGTSPDKGYGSFGYVRLESYNFTRFVPNIQPSIPNVVSSSTPPPAPPVIPQLIIASVGGQNAPSTPLGSFAAAPDITVPTAQTNPNPVSVVVQGANIPTGTTVKVTVTPEVGARTNAPDVTLTGSLAASTATASVTLPTGMSVILATATIDLTIAKNEPRFINGERVTRMEIAASYGGASEITYITESGKRIRQTE